MPEQHPALTIEATRPHQRHEVLLLLHLGRTRTKRLVEAAETGQIDMQGLYHARRDKRLVGAAWGQIMPGRTAFCWPPRVAAGEPEDTAARLQSAVDRHLDHAGVVMAQAVLPLDDVTDAKRLAKAGYRHLADLNYLVSALDAVPHSPPQTTLQFIPSKRGDLARWVELIDRTYRGTLDCSDLDGIRAIPDVLDSYRHTGVYRPEWWIRAQYRDQEVGCVLLADHPEHEQVELMYMGVVPEMRGRGCGLEMTRYAQWIAAAAGRDRLVLAVDESNWPAYHVYQNAGFQIWDRRNVLVRVIVRHADGSKVKER